MALAQSNSNTVNHEQTTTRSTRDIIGKSQEPRTTWWSLDFLRHKLSPASSEGLGRTWQNLQPEKYRESISCAKSTVWLEKILWCIIIRDVCAIVLQKCHRKPEAVAVLPLLSWSHDIQTLWADLKQPLRENGETASWIKTQFPHCHHQIIILYTHQQNAQTILAAS